MARSNLNIKEGTYVGTGVALNVTGLGFRPDLVIVKGGTTASVFRTKTVGDSSVDNTLYWGANTTSATAFITTILNDGFSIGTGATVNTLSTNYYWIAMRGSDAQSYFRAFRYNGTGSGSRALNLQGLNFTPNFWGVKKDGNDNPSWVSDQQTVLNAGHWSGLADATGEIDAIVANGVTANTSTRVNGNGSTYHGIAFKNNPGVIKVGSYTGTGTAQSISGVGFQPDILWVKNQATTDAGHMLTASIVTATGGSYNMGAAGQTATAITALNTDGFSVGSHASANGSGNKITYMAFKSGNWNVPVLGRLSS